MKLKKLMMRVIGIQKQRKISLMKASEAQVYGVYLWFQTRTT